MKDSTAKQAVGINNRRIYKSEFEDFWLPAYSNQIKKKNQENYNLMNKDKNERAAECR
jgi:hypothetical protein